AVYGDCPQILMEGITEDLDTMRALLASDTWEQLYEKLMTYVDGYQQKIVRANAGFQI
ncbi:MAG: hypothetical protein GX613_09780, partial [Chloroflexi bacterium]|nr:hypothetical protein [Chloroflexota bacterium]